MLAPRQRSLCEAVVTLLDYGFCALMEFSGREITLTTTLPDPPDCFAAGC